MKWISVKDRMPENEWDVVLVYDTYEKQIYTAHWCISSWHCKCECHEGSCLFAVSHWLEMPKPPEGL